MDSNLSERKIALQEKMFELKKQQFEFEKRLSQKQTKLFNPISATILVAIIGFITTMVVQVINNYNSNKLETRKLEFDVIKKGLEQPTKAEKVKYLQFLSILDLIKDADLRVAIDSTLRDPANLPDLSSTTPSSIMVSTGGDVNQYSYKLTVVGGELGYESSWYWSEADCNGKTVGSGRGRSIIVNPKKTTTYFVKAVGATGSTACINVTVLPEMDYGKK
jgi:hypothetical protein